MVGQLGGSGQLRRRRAASIAGELGAENLPPAPVPVPGARGASVFVWREQREGRTVPGRVGAVRAGRAGGGTGGVCKAL